ncbi:coil containing protein [Vibrio phage 1.170.O._10N.261.52.C3]|nr:coil containing protein [Vibrio phage 1.170.O._10N.261.52.C3]
MDLDQVVHVRTQVEPLAHRYTIRLDRTLTEPQYFQEELATLKLAGESDLIHVLINSGGGSDTVMKAFLNAMSQSSAHIICEIEGMCCSAVTMIFLAADEFRVNDDSEFMIHTQSLGYGGKENNVRQYIEFNAKANERLMKKYYKGFLTEEEITLTIEGKDFWMDSDEIMERLKLRKELFDKEQEDQEASAMEDMFSEMGFPSEEELLGMSKEDLIDFILGEEEPHPDLPEGAITLDLNHLNCMGLKAMADSLEIEYPKNVSEKKLRKMIEDFEENMDD